MNTLHRSIKFELSTAGRPPFLCSAEISRPVFFSLIPPSVAAIRNAPVCIIAYINKAAGRLSSIISSPSSRSRAAHAVRLF